MLAPLASKKNYVSGGLLLLSLGCFQVSSLSLFSPLMIIPTIIKLRVGVGGGITASMCLSVQAFCSDSILRTAQPYITQLVIFVHHHELECQAKHLVANFKVNVTMRAHIIQI